MSPTTAISGIEGGTGRREADPYASTRTDSLTSVARAMGLSKGDLADRLRSGQTIAEVAQAQGLRNEKLLAALQVGGPDALRRRAVAEGITAIAPAAAPAATSTDPALLRGAERQARGSGPPAPRAPSEPSTGTRQRDGPRKALPRGRFDIVV